MLRQTHTYVTLEVSAEAYDEIKALLTKAEYHHAFQDGLIDMHGIALERGRAVTSADERSSCNEGDMPISNPPGGRYPVEHSGAPSE